MQSQAPRNGESKNNSMIKNTSRYRAEVKNKIETRPDTIKTDFHVVLNQEPFREPGAWPGT